MSSRIAQMRALTRRAHAGQTRNGGRIPYWVHTDGVAQLCAAAIAAGREMPAEDAEDVVLAAYGHDLLEDTDVTKDQITELFGERVARWIGDLTNEQSDADRAQYQRKFAQASEEVRLVKCADLADNMLSVAYGLHDVGLPWARGFLLPIAQETRATLSQTTFQRFPVTGQYLLDLIGLGWERLVGAVETATGQTWAEGSSMADDDQPDLGDDTSVEALLARLTPTREQLSEAQERQEREEAEQGAKLFKGKRPFPIPDTETDS